MEKILFQILPSVFRGDFFFLSAGFFALGVIVLALFLFFLDIMPAAPDVDLGLVFTLRDVMFHALTTARAYEIRRIAHNEPYRKLEGKDGQDVECLLSRRKKYGERLIGSGKIDAEQGAYGDVPLLIKIGGDDAEPALREEPDGDTDERRRFAFEFYLSRKARLYERDDDVDRHQKREDDETVFERIEKNLSNHFTTSALPSMTRMTRQSVVPGSNSVQVMSDCTSRVTSSSIFRLSSSSSLNTSSRRSTGVSPLSFL